GNKTSVDGVQFADADFDNIVINSGNGNDTVAILATLKPVQVQGNSGDDTVTLGNANGVQDIFAKVSVFNNFGLTDLNINDTGDAKPRVVTMDFKGSQGSIVGLAPGEIDYTDATHSITVRAGTRGTTFNVLNTAISSSPNITITTTLI